MKSETLDILHVASGDIWAGAEAQVAMLSAAQIQLGHRVRAATFVDGVLAERLRTDRVETRVIDEREGGAYVWSSLRRWFSEDLPDVVHVHGYKEAIVGFGATIGYRIARVRTLHGVPELPHGVGAAKMKLYDAADRFLARALRAHWIAVSHSLELELQRRYQGRVHRTVNAVSIGPPSRTPEDLRAELGIGPGDAPILLYAGRLEPIKGPDVLIEAFATIVRQHPGATLLMAGAGSSELLLREEIARFMLGERVHLLGNRRDVRDLMAMADLFVLPSRGEGMPTVLLEALVCGCPVVATAVGAIPEVTRDGALAYLVPTNQPTALATACLELLRDDARRAEQVALGTREVSSRYSPRRAAAEADTVYTLALSDLGRPRNPHS